MKLLMCTDCGDLFNLTMTKKSCSCGLVSGWYKNYREAVVNGNGVSIAMGNGDLSYAIARVHSSGGSPRDRHWWLDKNKITCWARPHTGEGNPHTAIEGAI